MPDTALLKLMGQAADAAHAAGSLLLEQPQPAAFTTWAEFKAAFDSVNGPASALLRERLGPLSPGVPWAEEIDTELADTGDFWVIDAIDGAIQYLQRLPQWSVSIALIRDGQPVLAALHSATLGHTYTAARGGGAFLDGSPITPSIKTALELTLVGTSQPPYPARQPDAVAAAGRAMTALLPKVGVVRNLGPTSWQLADVASGRIDAFWEYGRDATNLLAGSLLASEAGTIVTDASGAPWRATSDSFLTAPAGLHAGLIDVLTAETTSQTRRPA
jgi:myo-inositol-1(or 4)-monophosphatase